MKLAKYFLAVSVTAVICVFGMRWHYTGSFIQRQRAETDILNDTYYKIHISIYERMPSSEGGIVFLGDSITDYAPFSEIFFSSGLPVINRGRQNDQLKTGSTGQNVQFRKCRNWSKCPTRLVKMSNC